LTGIRQAHLTFEAQSEPVYMPKNEKDKQELFVIKKKIITLFSKERLKIES
jgi:hypothetical protein